MRPTPDRRAVAFGIALALLLTAIELGLFDVEMRREAARIGHAPADRVLHVDLIEEERPVEPSVVEPAPAAPLVPPVEHRPRARVVHRAAPREPVPVSVPSNEKPRLFGLDGHVLLPEQTAASGDAGAFPEHVEHGDAFARTNPVPYAPTRFEKYFPDVRESLGGEIMRKTTLSYSWITPWGTQWTCKTNLLLLGMGGCGWGPAPRLTAEELKAIRAPDLPLPVQPQPPPQAQPPLLLPLPPADDPPAVFDPTQP